MADISVWKIQGGKAYWKSCLVSRADANSFEPLNEIWAADSERVYLYDKLIRGADRNSFVVLNGLWAKDKYHAYYSFGKVKDADSSTFVALDSGIYEYHGGGISHSGFAADSNYVFHYVRTVGKPSILRGADPGSFRVIAPNFGKDSDRVFYGHARLPGADPSSFRLLGKLYSTDGRKIYYLNRRVKGADLETFEVFKDDECRARDKHGAYHWDNLVESGSRGH